MPDKFVSKKLVDFLYELTRTPLPVRTHTMPEKVVCENPVAFLYELMRDHLPVGMVRDAVPNSVCRDWKYSDEDLRQIAWDMACTLQNGK